MNVETLAQLRCWSQRRSVREAAIALSFLGWCALLLAARVTRTGTIYYTFLVWNLFLATIPFCISYWLLYHPGSRLRAALLLPLWLLFFPNAPYLMTDLVHLYPNDGAPVWFNLILLLTAASAGLFLGYTSLRHVQKIAERALGPIVGWCVVVPVLFLSAFGIYLGRFQRWNSWDVILSPISLAHAILERCLQPLEHPRTWAVTLGFGVLMALGYAGAAIVSNEDPAES